MREGTPQLYTVDIICGLPLVLYTNNSKKERTVDAQREATERYNRKTYERIELKVKKGQKDYIQKAAASVGKSVNRFILDLVAKETGNDEI